MKRKKPRFPRQHAHTKKRAKEKWRKPRGIDSKQRKGVKAKGAHPKIGYGTARRTRGLHPTGFAERLVRNMKDLEGMSEKEVARIAACVGKKKRQALEATAAEKKIKVLNPHGS